MPEISRFLGIAVTMYYNDHAPPHFHARYGNYRIKVFLDTGEVEGQFPRRALGHVLEWWALHRHELDDDWRRAREGLPLLRIAGLE